MSKVKFESSVLQQAVNGDKEAITKMFFRPSGIPEMLPKITTRPATI